MSETKNSNVVPKDSNLYKLVQDLEKRMQTMENLLDSAKEVLTVEEAAKFMGIARSTLYKMTSEQTIPFYRPNGKMIYFEKADLLEWVRQNRVSTKVEIENEAKIHEQKLSRRGL